MSGSRKPFQNGVSLHNLSLIHLLRIAQLHMYRAQMPQDQQHFGSQPDGQAGWLTHGGRLDSRLECLSHSFAETRALVKACIDLRNDRSLESSVASIDFVLPGAAAAASSCSPPALMSPASRSLARSKLSSRFQLPKLL